VELVLFKEIETNDSILKVLPSSVQMKLNKKDQDDEFWPRLLADKHLEKTNVKLDWDRYVDEDEETEGFDTKDLDGGYNLGGMGGMPGMGGMGGMPGMGGMGGMAGMEVCSSLFLRISNFHFRKCSVEWEAWEAWTWVAWEWAMMRLIATMVTIKTCLILSQPRSRPLSIWTESPLWLIKNHCSFEILVKTLATQKSKSFSNLTASQ
jgi:hypothetical protein